MHCTNPLSFFNPLGHPMKVTVSTALFLGPCHVSVICALMFKGSICLEIQTSQISIFNTRVSAYSLYSPYYISMSVLCRWWRIHQGPPSTSIFLSTSAHHSRLRLRNQLVPWNLHASISGSSLLTMGLHHWPLIEWFNKCLNSSHLFTFIILY